MCLFLTVILDPEWYWNYQMTNGSETQGTTMRVCLCAIAMSAADPTAAFHNATYGADFKYQDFNQWFTGMQSIRPWLCHPAHSLAAELFNATQWLEIIKSSGAQVRFLLDSAPLAVPICTYSTDRERHCARCCWWCCAVRCADLQAS